MSQRAVSEPNAPLRGPNAPLDHPNAARPAGLAVYAVSGLERRKREIHFPKPLSWTLKFLRILPYPLYQRMIVGATRGRQLAKEASLRD